MDEEGARLLLWECDCPQEQAFRDANNGDRHTMTTDTPCPECGKSYFSGRFHNV